MPRYGTLALADLLARRDISITNYGPDRVVAAITTAVNAHNADVDALIVDIGIEPTTDRIRSVPRSIGGLRGRMHRVNEFGAVDVQRVRTGPITTDNMGFPLDRWQFAAGFTRDYIETRTPADAAEQTQGIVNSDMDRIEYEVQNAFFNPVSNATYTDYLLDDLTIPIRRFWNNDGMPPPPYRNTTFSGTHNHYLGRVGGTLADADITALFTNVLEHGSVGPVELWINLADVPTVSAFPNFYEFDPVELIIPNLAAGVAIPRGGNPTMTTVNPEQPENRPIGRWQAVYTIRTKPWVPAGYGVVVDTGKNPLAWRVRDSGPARGDTPARDQLRLVGEHEHFPLRAEWMEREFGIATQERGAGALLYFGGTSYVMPTITMPVV